MEFNKNHTSLKEKREAEKKAKETAIRSKCEDIAIERYGSKEALDKVSNANQGIWYLPVMNENDEVEKLLIFKPIDRVILGEALTKLEEGTMVFIETAMRSCVISEHSDMDMFTDEEYFLSASTTFYKILDTKKTFLVKR